MSVTLKGRFATRREAEMTIERLVQEHRLDRGAIFVTAEGESNSAGVEAAGSDIQSGEPSEEARNDAPLADAILVIATLDDEQAASEVRSAFSEFSADDVEEAAGGASQP